MTLHAQRCVQHPSREAVARCPSCVRFYCRECVVEHDGRLLCTSCLAKSSAPVRRSRGIAAVAWFGAAAAGLLMAWASFYYTGSLLAKIPSEFHQDPGE